MDEVAIVGVGDALMGEVPSAVVVLRPGAQPTEADLLEFARERLPAYQVPVAVTIVDDLRLRNEIRGSKPLRADLAARYGTSSDRRGG